MHSENVYILNIEIRQYSKVRFHFVRIMYVLTIHMSKSYQMCSHHTIYDTSTVHIHCSHSIPIMHCFLESYQGLIDRCIMGCKIKVSCILSMKWQWINVDLYHFIVIGCWTCALPLLHTWHEMSHFKVINLTRICNKYMEFIFQVMISFHINILNFGHNKI